MANGDRIGLQYEGQADFLLLDGQIESSDGKWVNTANVGRVSITLNQMEIAGSIEIHVSNADVKPDDTADGIVVMTDTAIAQVDPPGEIVLQDVASWFRWTKAKKVEASSPLSSTVIFHGWSR